MKIAMIQCFLPGSSRGGVGYFAHDLANSLVRRGHKVTIFSYDPRPEKAEYEVFPVPHAGGNTKWNLIHFPFDVAKCDFSSFDIIHAQGDEQWIPRNLNIPVIRTLHGSALMEACYNGFKRFSFKHFLLHLFFYLNESIAVLRADFVASVSQDTKRYYPRIHDVIGNGVNLELFSPKDGSKSSHPSILFVGELQSRKRGALLVKIFNEEIKTQVPDSELWLVCPEKIEGEGIRWFGAVKFEELAELYRTAWVFCMPSAYEGFGRPYIEAMASGTAVLATPNAGAKEVLGHGKYGRLVSVDELGSSLRQLLNEKSLRQEYERLGLDRAKYFSRDFIAERYEKIYEKLIENRQKKAADE